MPVLTIFPSRPWHLGTNVIDWAPEQTCAWHSNKGHISLYCRTVQGRLYVCTIPVSLCVSLVPARPPCLSRFRFQQHRNTRV